MLHYPHMFNLSLLIIMFLSEFVIKFFIMDIKLFGFSPILLGFRVGYVKEVKLVLHHLHIIADILSHQ